MDKNPDWNVNSVNPLHLLIIRVYGSVSEKDGHKYLTIDKGDSVGNSWKEFKELKSIDKKYYASDFYDVRLVNMVLNVEHL